MVSRQAAHYFRHNLLAKMLVGQASTGELGVKTCNPQHRITRLARLDSSGWKPEACHLRLGQKILVNQHALLRVKVWNHLEKLLQSLAGDDQNVDFLHHLKT